MIFGAIRVEDRNAYLNALDRASIDMDIGPFAAFVPERVAWVVERREHETGCIPRNPGAGCPLDFCKPVENPLHSSYVFNPSSRRMIFSA